VNNLIDRIYEGRQELKARELKSNSVFFWDHSATSSLIARFQCRACRQFRTGTDRSGFGALNNVLSVARAALSSKQYFQQGLYLLGCMLQRKGSMQ
jgi:hypothetical protein